MSDIPGRFKVKIVMGMPPDPAAGAIWMFYGLGRANYISRHPDLYEGQPAQFVPRFEEECVGRFMLADGAANSVKRGEPVPPGYLCDALKIHEAGYLSEYVWLFLNRPSWPLDSQPPKLPIFMVWAQKELKDHEIETYGGVELEPLRTCDSTAQVKMAPPLDVRNAGGENLRNHVTAMAAMLRNGRSAEMMPLFDEFDRAVKALQIDPAARYGCFRSHRELNFYLEENPSVKVLRVLDWCVAEGKHLQAYALSHTRRFPEALVCLEQLLRLAPTFAQAHVEHGFIFNQLRQPKSAASAYARAWELTSRLPENLSSAPATLRGRAVTAVELGELDSAEKWLHDSLIVDPDNLIAMQELDYISQIRRNPTLRTVFNTK